MMHPQRLYGVSETWTSLRLLWFDPGKRSRNQADSEPGFILHALQKLQQCSLIHTNDYYETNFFS